MRDKGILLMMLPCVLSISLQLTLLFPLCQALAAETEEETGIDFSSLSASDQEEAFEYRTFFLPSPDGFEQPFVGDPMPYYEDGTYYIYYLKEGGDSYRHSIYLAETKDFTSWTEIEEPILVSSDDGQDQWIGTGSVCRRQDTLYFFYTGHRDVGDPYKETILLAKGKDFTSFEKVEGWEITPPDSLGQKNDFRDPQVVYDEERDVFLMTVTASQEGKARILNYQLSGDLKDCVYDGILFTDPEEAFWNLECSDTFQMGDTWYLTYSGQDDTLWYARSEDRNGPYTDAERLDGKLFYAAKHVTDGEKTYMAGWARRSQSPTSTREVGAWAGNLEVLELVQQEDGSLTLKIPETVEEKFTQEISLAGGTDFTLKAAADPESLDAFYAGERFLITGDVTFTGEGVFGFSFDFKGEIERAKTVEIAPKDQVIRLCFNQGQTLITETKAALQEGKTYRFSYLQEGSVGVLSIENTATLSVRLYGAAGKPIRIYAKDMEVKFSDIKEYSW